MRRSRASFVGSPGAGVATRVGAGSPLREGRGSGTGADAGPGAGTGAGTATPGSGIPGTTGIGGSVRGDPTHNKTPPPTSPAAANATHGNTIRPRRTTAGCGP